MNNTKRSSWALLRAVLIAATIAGIFGCKTGPIQPENGAAAEGANQGREPAPASTSRPTLTEYTVQDGDSLSKIAYAICCDADAWQDLYYANQDLVRNPTFLTVGWDLAVPEGLCGDGSAARYAETGEANCKPAAHAVAAAPREITLVTGNEYAPFSGEHLMQGGMITEIVVQTFSAMGYQTEVTFLGWDDAIARTRRGEYTGSFPWVKNAERQQDFIYSDALYNIFVLPFIRANDKPFKGRRSNQYSGLDDMAGLKLCRPAGYYTHDLKQILDQPGTELKRPETLGDCFDLLNNGAVDVVPVNRLSGQKTLNSKPYADNIRMLDQNSVSVQALHLILPKTLDGSPDLRAEFDDSVAAMKNSGALDRLIQKHLKAYYD